MSRRSRAQRKLAEADPIYNSRLVTLLVSRVLQAGKKSLAQKIVYGVFEKVSEELEKGDPIDLLLGAGRNSKCHQKFKMPSFYITTTLQI